MANGGAQFLGFAPQPELRGNAITGLAQGLSNILPGLFGGQTVLQNQALQNQQFRGTLGALLGATPGQGQFNQLAQSQGLPAGPISPGQGLFDQFSNITSPQAQQAVLGGMIGQQFRPTPAPTIVPEGGTAIDRFGQPIFTAQPKPVKPTAFQETTKEINRLANIPEADRTPTEQRRLDQLLGGADEDTVSQLRAREIKRLQAKKNKTPEESASLKKLLEGGPLVEIGLGKPASPAERTAIAETRASIDALDNLKTLFDSPQTKTGPITGRVSKIAGIAGQTTPEQESLLAATAAFKNQVIKDITGAQMSEVEARRIMEQIPDVTDPPVRWNARWQQTKRNLKAIQKRRSEVLKQSGIRSPEAGTGDATVDSIAERFGF